MRKLPDLGVGPGCLTPHPPASSGLGLTWTRGLPVAVLAWVGPRDAALQPPSVQATGCAALWLTTGYKVSFLFFALFKFPTIETISITNQCIS